MMTQMIDRFCESQNRWLIVTSITFVAGFLTVYPQVDHYFAQREKQQNIQQNLISARQAAQRLPLFAKQEKTETEILASLEQRTIDEERLPEFRGALVDLVRESGCQMRRINVGPPRFRPWHADDNPVTEPNKDAKPTPFTLEMRALSLSVSGASSAIRNLLTRIEAEQIIYHAKTMGLSPAGTNRRGVQMDLELWYFALSRESDA